MEENDPHRCPPDTGTVTGGDSCTVVTGARRLFSSRYDVPVYGMFVYASLYRCLYICVKCGQISSPVVDLFNFVFAKMMNLSTSKTVS